MAPFSKVLQGKLIYNLGEGYLNRMSRRPARTLEGEALFQYAVKRLASRACSAGELREKLRVRAEHPEDVDVVIARLKEYGYLDDRAFAEGYAAARLEDRRLGARRVVRDLQGRRVAPSLAEAIVKDVYADVDEEVLIEQYVRRKFRAADPFRDEKSMAAAYGRLLRAGFTPGNIMRVLKKMARNPELLDGFDPPEEPIEE